MGMESTFTITERDYVRATLLFSNPTKRGALIYLALSGALALAAVTLPFPHWLLAIGALVGGIIGGLSFHFGLTPYVAKRHYRNYKAIQEPVKIRLQDDGVWLKNDDFQGVLKWEKMHKWRQNDHYLLVYRMPRLFHIIPKSVTATGFDMPALTSTLQTKIGPSK
ncbi:MAG: hypothetical protein GKS02_12675 [Alphaproteobacteria bacterium]|nr:hypothetical protein [Alphaproteobacteria bacterium]